MVHGRNHMTKEFQRPNSTYFLNGFVFDFKSLPVLPQVLFHASLPKFPQIQMHAYFMLHSRASSKANTCQKFFNPRVLVSLLKIP